MIDSQNKLFSRKQDSDMMIVLTQGNMFLYLQTFNLKLSVVHSVRQELKLMSIALVKNLISVK